MTDGEDTLHLPWESVSVPVSLTGVVKNGGGERGGEGGCGGGGGEGGPQP